MGCLKAPTITGRQKIMEELQSTALDVLNNEHLSMKDKMSFLESFKKDAKLTLATTKRIKTKEKLVEYISWLRRQIESLKNNCPFIVK